MKDLAEHIDDTYVEDCQDEYDRLRDQEVEDQGNVTEADLEYEESAGRY